MTLRVAVLTSGPVGNTGNVLARIVDVPGVEVRAVPLLMQSDELSAAMVHSALELAGV